MELKVDQEILEAYGFTATSISLQQIGSGHINSTYLLSSTIENNLYILQNINVEIFKDPEIIANNVKAVANFLKSNYPSYLFPAPIETTAGHQMAYHKGQYWRLMPFVPNAIALDTLNNPKQAYEAAKQFGKLSRLLQHFDTSLLRPTIPGFHDLAWRYEQFNFALNQATVQLKEQAKHEIDLAIDHHFIIDYYRSYANSLSFPNRVMHHDTKISNVLLDEQTHQGICVIDLDTLMPGKFISDLGDMMRTYLCAFSENETNLDQIKIRLPYFKATVEGYLSEMSDILTEKEKELILFAGKYIIYMQALRFLSDFLNGSIYYPIAYPLQNLDRAKNQFKLLKEFFDNEKILQGIIEECLS